ncbi:hypothetical protein PROFUN_09393 [Planoprotostelium fungivorum]|uniref:Ubiquitin-like protein ATG12 n=1 Tax=Planoprotostelium fungivorum TaxID=1890364 RepID=A0A2P6NHC9_9EUKA|nr:hypothetical protein PROFUN_09393 [Planoprotostelium fungivorum]
MDPPTPEKSISPSSIQKATEVPDKVVILFKETGSAPALKQNKFKLSSAATFKDVLLFLRKQLQVQAEDSLFLFVNGAFQPSAEESVGILYKCFHSGNKLIVNYSSTQAFG